MCMSFSRCGTFQVIKGLCSRGPKAQSLITLYLDLSTWGAYISCTSVAGFIAESICIKSNNYPQEVDHLLLLFLTWSCHHPSHPILESSPRLTTETVHGATRSRNSGRPQNQPGPRALSSGSSPKGYSILEHWFSKTGYAWQLPGGLVKHNCWTQFPVSDLVGLGWSLSICYPNKFPAILLVPKPCF